MPAMNIHSQCIVVPDMYVCMCVCVYATQGGLSCHAGWPGSFALETGRFGRNSTTRVPHCWWRHVFLSLGSSILPPCSLESRYPCRVRVMHSNAAVMRDQDAGSSEWFQQLTGALNWNQRGGSLSRQSRKPRRNGGVNSAT